MTSAARPLHDLVDQGRLGVKAGDGFYRYAPGQGRPPRHGGTPSSSSSGTS